MGLLQIGLEFDFLILFFTLILATVVLAGGITYLEHRKEMALIEAGMYDPEAADSRAWVLGGGLILLALGLAEVTTLLVGGVPQEGIAATFVGLAALAYYFYKRRASERRAPESATRS